MEEQNLDHLHVHCKSRVNYVHAVLLLSILPPPFCDNLNRGTALHLILHNISIKISWSLEAW